MTDEPQADRQTVLETALMHLQHEVEQLHLALLGQRKEIDALRKVVERLAGRLDRAELDPEPRDPAAEKPPHY